MPKADWGYTALRLGINRCVNYGKFDMRKGMSWYQF